MMYCFCILKVYNAFRTSLAECLSTQSDISVPEIDLKLEQLQKELISKALSNEDFAELNSQILDLKERKQKIFVYEDRLSVELKTGDSVDIML